MPLKLLIAEDEDRIRSGISGYIHQSTDAFDVILTAADGQSAIDIIFRERPDIMLLDIQMPKKTGLEVMKEASQANVLPITIILSGYEDFSYAQQAIKYGAKEYLLKPSRAADIVNCLLQAVGLPSNQNNASNDIQPIKENNQNYAIKRAKEFIEEHYYEDISLEQAATSAGISTGYLCTLFSRNLKISVVDYINKIRIEHASDYLRQGTLKIYEIAYKVGFHDEKYFSKVFKKITSFTPYEYKTKCNLSVGLDALNS